MIRAPQGLARIGKRIPSNGGSTGSVDPLLRIGFLAASLWAFVICVPGAGLAQSTTPLTVADLSGNLEPGSSIFVTDRSGLQTEGRFLHVSPGELVVLTGGKEQRVPSSRVGRVETRDPLWNGVLLGAVPIALVGGAAAGASCSPRCGRDVSLAMLMFGAIGAGVGALVDSRIRGYAILAGPPLAPPNARSVPSPVTSLDELWLRVRQGDRVGVVTRNGKEIKGRFISASSASSVTVAADGREEAIPSSEVLRITRAGNRYRSGALWGGTIAGAMGIVASAACSGGGCGNPLFVAAFAGTAGAFWGMTIGAVIPKQPTVYESGGSSTVQFLPIAGPDRVAVVFSATF